LVRKLLGAAGTSSWRFRFPLPLPGVVIMDCRIVATCRRSAPTNPLSHRSMFSASQGARFALAGSWKFLSHEREREGARERECLFRYLCVDWLERALGLFPDEEQEHGLPSPGMTPYQRDQP